MSAVIRPNFHHTMAESIYEKIQNRSANYHYYLGKVLPWGFEGAIADAPNPLNNMDEENESRNNIIGIKQININDVSFITRRIDWSSKVFAVALLLQSFARTTEVASHRTQQGDRQCGEISVVVVRDGRWHSAEV